METAGFLTRHRRFSRLIAICFIAGTFVALASLLFPIGRFGAFSLSFVIGGFPAMIGILGILSYGAPYRRRRRWLSMGIAGELIGAAWFFISWGSEDAEFGLILLLTSSLATLTLFRRAEAEAKKEVAEPSPVLDASISSSRHSIRKKKHRGYRTVS